MALALGIAGIVGGISSIFSSNKAADATKQAATQQSAIAKQAAGQNAAAIGTLASTDAAAASDFQSNVAGYITDAQSSINSAYDKINNIISNIPSVSQEYGTAQDLSQQDFNFRDNIQKQNLAFELGGSANDLRGAQSSDAALANFDPSGFNSGINKIINANLLNLKALTVGEPTGSFANLSAANLQNFSQQGLSDSLGIDDYFKQAGTVDPISPLQTAFQLQNVDQSIAGLGIQGAEFQGQQLAGIDESAIGAQGTGLQAQLGAASQIAGLTIGSNNQLAGTLENNAGADALASQQQAAGVTSALGTITQGLTGAFGLNLQQQALNNQSLYQQQLLNTLASRNSINSFAPNTLVGAGTGNGYSNGVFTPSSSAASLSSSLALPSGVGSISNSLFGF